MEKLPDSKTQEKLAKVFKAVISAGLVAPVFVSVSACEKAKLVEVVEKAETTTAESTAQTNQETISQITTPETTAEIKKFEGLKIDLITDPSFSKATFERQGETFVPKEVVYRDGTGPQKMEEALMITWALALKEQAQHPALSNIDSKDQEGLLLALRGLLDKGETPTFILNLKKDWSVAAPQAQKSISYEVDMTKGVKIIFVGEMTGMMSYENYQNPNSKIPKDFVDSKDFFWLTYYEGEIDKGIRMEVTDNGELTIKIFSKKSREFLFCGDLGVALQTIVDQKFNYADYGENQENPGKPNYKPIRLIRDAIYDGNQWDENDKWLEFGEPIIVRNY